MTLKEDIINRIKIDFGKNQNQAFDILKSSTKKYEYLNHERIIRCIIFLADGSIKKLLNTIDQVKNDPRDAMLWAEYEGLKENEKLKRVRDFNNTFEDCEKNVKE